MNILGRPTVGLDTIKKNLPQFDPHPRFEAEMLLPLWIKANEYGIDPVVMIAQSILETDEGKFTGVIGPERHNTCGLKNRVGGADDDPDAHEVSFDWYEGAEKHAQHLLAYCQVDLPSGKQLIDPRWRYVRNNPVYMPGAVDVVELNKWSTSINNGPRILAIALKLSASPKIAKKITTSKSLEIQ